VSVAEIASRGGEFERTPPHDVAAEQCVLGGMLLSKDAISDVIEVIHPQDHYRPAHQIIHEVILDLYARGEPADAVTAAAELTKRGDLGRAGGAPYLHTLIASVPTAANAGYYARIVRERAILRRLVEVGTRIVQLGYSGDGDADEIVDRAQAEVYGVTERRVSEDYLPLSEIMPGTLDEIEAIGSRGGGMVGVPTGFSDLDSLTNGLHPGQMIVIAARPAVGKALALDTPLPTPAGWTTMGDVQAGDYLFGADGKPTRVLAVTGVMSGRSCLEVEFNDGTVIVADAEHGWLTDTRASGMSAAVSATGCDKCRHQRGFASVKTTRQIAATIRCEGGDKRLNHSVPVAAALDLPTAGVAIPPYVLGVWLGDVHSAGPRFTSADPEIALHLETEGMCVTQQSKRYLYSLQFPDHIGSFTSALRELGVLSNKRIPVSYLRGSEAQRRALLAGLLDVDGTVNRAGSIQFSVTSGGLGEDFRELVTSLGYRCSWSETQVRGKCAGSSPADVITFTTEDDLFRLERKRIIHKDRRPAKTLPRTGRRYITAVRAVPSVPVRCVQVDNAEHLYLASRAMIPTHNSTLALDIARAAAVRNALATVIFSLEMGRNEITMRLLSAEARVPLHTMRTGQMSDDDWARLARRMGEVAEAPLFIDDSPNMSMMEIRAKCRRLKQRHDLRIVIVDYMQLMSSPKRVESRQQEVSEMSRALKLLAKELDVPVIAISQLNRGPEQRNDKRPLLSDLRESGCLTRDTRILRADTGAEVSLGELIASGERDIPVWSLDARLRLVPATMTHVFPSGVKEVFRVRLTSGREVRATANHPFLTHQGWRSLGGLAPGARVAVPRDVPPPLVARGMPEPEIIVFAHLLGAGSFVRSQPIGYASKDESSLAAVTEAAKHLGITAIRIDDKAACHVSLPPPYQLTHGRPDPIAAWLESLGLSGFRSGEKFVPASIFSLPRQQLALFLHHLWAAGGSVTVGKTGAGRICYSTASERLARDLQSLLLRFNIKVGLRPAGNNSSHPKWAVDVCGVADQRRFLCEVGVHAERRLSIGKALRHLESMATVRGGFDTVPAETVRADIASAHKVWADTVPARVWERVREVINERTPGFAEIEASVRARNGEELNPSIGPTWTRLGRITDILKDGEFEMVATNDVYWDEIASIDSLGEEAVYDATVLKTHNFIANGINLHNSIEQDSDVVILLHREDAYERESPRAGEADLIVAKHRNGPTATVTVAFQGHYSRFVDMAPG